MSRRLYVKGCPSRVTTENTLHRFPKNASEKALQFLKDYLKVSVRSFLFFLGTLPTKIMMSAQASREPLGVRTVPRLRRSVVPTNFPLQVTSH
ncbi:unnamed protein product [Ixodes pacificus]